MIVKVGNKNVMVTAPQKCGITTVVNLLGYPYTGNITTKGKVREVLRQQDRLVLFGSTDGPDPISEPEDAARNNIQADIKIAIVRDPIERLKSAFLDRVYSKNMDKLKDRSFQYFFENFEDLVKRGTDVGKHSRPQTLWFGEDSSYYDSVIFTKDINSFISPIVEELTGVVPPADVRKNVSKKTPVELTEEHISFFKEFYAKDYAFIESAGL